MPTELEKARDELREATNRWLQARQNVRELAIDCPHGETIEEEYIYGHPRIKKTFCSICGALLLETRNYGERGMV